MLILILGTIFSNKLLKKLEIISAAIFMFETGWMIGKYKTNNLLYRSIFCRDAGPDPAQPEHTFHPQ